MYVGTEYFPGNGLHDLHLRFTYILSKFCNFMKIFCPNIYRMLTFLGQHCYSFCSCHNITRMVLLLTAHMPLASVAAL